ncbi:hypothetical protein [Glaciihabitans sp. UYNi722]|uniref:hypothetical protein n=1 Tax=Glaciihabitans sp. UYNi722 TaxID=3156344 RepID=UPI0033918B82
MADEIDPRYDPAFQRGFTPPPAPPRIEVVGPPPPAVVQQQPVAAPEPRDSPVEPFSRRVNPYFAALWAIAAVFVIGGAGLYLVSLRGLYSASDGLGNSRVLAQFAYAFSPPLMTIGLAIVIGLIFVKAARLHNGRS